VPKTLGYSFLNESSEKPLAGKISGTQSNLPKGYVVYGPWQYRGELGFYDTNDGQSTILGTDKLEMFGYDLAGFNTETGSAIPISIPVSGSPNLVCLAQDAATCISGPPAAIPGSYASLSGSSAIVALGYTQRVPDQTIPYGAGLVANVPAQWTTDVYQWTGGAWTEYQPSGPSPSEFDVVTASCSPPGAGGSYQYQLLEQTRRPVQVVPSGYAAFVYQVETSKFGTPGCDPADLGLTQVEDVVADLHVGGTAHDLATFAPESAAPGSPTCDEQPPCAADLGKMWGNVELQDHVLRDVSRGESLPMDYSGNIVPSGLTRGGLEASFDFENKWTDGVSAIWPTTHHTIQLWNGRIGVLQNFTDPQLNEAPFDPHRFVDGEWAAWTSQASRQFNSAEPVWLDIYDMDDRNQSAILSPRVDRVQLQGQLDSSRTADFPVPVMAFANGTAVWVSTDRTQNATTGEYAGDHDVLHWYNETLARAAEPAAGTLDLSWIDIGHGGHPDDIVEAADGWVYLAATANATDVTNHTNVSQIYALKIPAPVFATSSGGAAIAIGWTSSLPEARVQHASYDAGPDGRATNLELQLGTGDRAANVTLTLPKDAIVPDPSAVVTIDGQPAQPAIVKDAEDVHLSFMLDPAVRTIAVKLESGPSASASGSGTATTIASGAPPTGGPTVSAAPTNRAPGVTIPLLAGALALTAALTRRRRCP
jgi:hypothetical protein